MKSKVREGGGRQWCSRHQSRDSLAAHERNNTKADIHTAAHGGLHTGAGEYALKGTAALRRAHAGADFHLRTATCQKDLH